MTIEDNIEKIAEQEIRNQAALHDKLRIMDCAMWIGKYKSPLGLFPDSILIQEEMYGIGE